MIATRRHARGEEGDASVDAGGGDGLIASLAGARDDDMLAVPLRLSGEHIERAHETQHHAGEISFLPILTVLVPIPLHRPGIEVGIELPGLTIRQAMGVHIHGQETLGGPAGRPTQRTVVHAGPMDREDDGQALALGPDWLRHVSGDREAERRCGDVEGFYVRERRFDGSDGGSDRDGRELLFHAGPEGVEIVRNRQAARNLGRFDRRARHG